MSFKDEAKALLLKKGQLVHEEGKSYYWGWHDYENDIGGYYNHHQPGCRWIDSENSRIVEKTYYEFDGTDNDASQETLLVLTDVDCYCGHVTGRRVGVQGTTGSLLQEILGIEVDYE